MPIFTLLFVLVLVGVALWLVNSVVPMDPKIKTILNVVVILLVIIWLLDIFVGLGHLGAVRVGR